MEPVPILNMSKLFNKEILLYSLFDIRFKKPVRIMVMVYFAFLFFLWSYPCLQILPHNVFGYTTAFLPAIILSNYMAKPIWGGKSFFAWLKSQISYILHAKFYFDGKSSLKLASYDTDMTILVSRQTDFYNLKMTLKALK